MKNILTASVLAMCAMGTAMAGYTVTETETITTWESLEYVAPAQYENVRYRSSRDVKPYRPCAKKAAQPVRVKTHTEVIDHYQVYQPVTVYQPMGSYVERRVVPVKSCNKCGQY